MFLNVSPISRAHILKRKICLNVKSLTYCFQKKTKILAAFHICISVPLFFHHRHDHIKIRIHLNIVSITSIRLKHIFYCLFFIKKTFHQIFITSAIFIFKGEVKHYTTWEWETTEEPSSWLPHRHPHNILCTHHFRCVTRGERVGLSLVHFSKIEKSTLILEKMPWLF